MKLSGPTGRFYTLFQAVNANCFCAVSLFFEWQRALLGKLRAARIRSRVVQLGAPLFGSKKKQSEEICAMKVPFRTYLLIISFAATQLSCGGGGSSAAPASTSPAPKMSHVFVVVEENHSFNSVIGSPDSPFLNGLVPQGALAAQYFANAHPSLPNYLCSPRDSLSR